MTNVIYLFGDCELCPGLKELRRNGHVVPIEPKVFDLLLCLVENRNRLLTRDELHQQIWQGRPVSDAALSSCIRLARRAVGDSGERQEFIRTVPRRGFRFTAPVEARQPTSVSGPFTPSGRDSTAIREARARKPSIAVLPFRNLSGDPEPDHFAAGISEDITTGLSTSRAFLVIAPKSSLSPRGRPVDVRDAARQLRVRYVLVGSVRCAGRHIRVNAQLLDARSGQYIWAQSFDRELEDLFQVQDELTGAIVAAIGSEVDRAERERARRRSIERLDAWSAYQRGLHHLYRFAKTDLEAAGDFLRLAIDLDPTFALAYAGLSAVSYSRALLGYSDERKDLVDEARALAQRSVALDEKDATAHWALGRAYKLRGEHDAAISEFKTAITLNPSFAHAHYNIGWALSLAGEPERAIVHIDQALRLSPWDPLLFAFMIVRAHAHLQTDEDNRAMSWAEKAARQPNAHVHTKAVYAVTLQRCGQHEAAVQVVDEIRAERPEYSSRLFEQSFAFKRDRDMSLLIEAMGAAGLPEE